MVKNFLLEIHILRAILGNIFATVASITAENDILHFSEGGACIAVPSVCHCSKIKTSQLRLG